MQNRLKPFTRLGFIEWEYLFFNISVDSLWIAVENLCMTQKIAFITIFAIHQQLVV
jgi:hypothetical protein